MEEYICPTCGVHHLKASNIGKCGTCGRVICTYCKKTLDLYDACAVVTYENIVEMKNYTTESVVLCRKCHSQIEIIVDGYKSALIDLQTTYKKSFDKIRDSYLERVSKLLHNLRKKQSPKSISENVNNN
jgi:hypothetical protein